MTKQTNLDSNARNLRHWQAHVKAQKKSGLNRAEYCRQHKLSYHALTYWYNKSSGAVSKKSTIVPVPYRSIAKLPLLPESSALKLILPGNISIEVGDNFSPTTLTRLLASLEGR